MSNKRPFGLIAPPLIIGFLAIENRPKVKLGKAGVTLLKIKPLGSCIWSLLYSIKMKS